LHPLSVDGREGRQFQQILIDDAVHKCLKNSAFVHDLLARCDTSFREFVQDQTSRPSLLHELTVEFASAIDAEFVRQGTQSAERYLNQSRESWLRIPTKSAGHSD
jgi:hypothetical protein